MKQHFSTKKWYRRTQLSECGDTIIEVLIAVGILSLALTSAFVLTRQNAAVVRDTQDRATVLQLLRSQAELLRSHAFNETPATPQAQSIFGSSPAYFCMARNGSGKVNFASDVAQIEGNMSRYPAGCIFDTYYHIAIRYNASNRVFTIQGSWDTQAKGIGREQLLYKL